MLSDSIWLRGELFLFGIPYFSEVSNFTYELHILFPTSILFILLFISIEVGLMQYSRSHCTSLEEVNSFPGMFKVAMLLIQLSS